MKAPREALPVRLYRRALVLLPSTFRRRCGAAMVAMLSDEWRSRRGSGRAVLMARALVDLLWTALLESGRLLFGGREPGSGEPGGRGTEVRGGGAGGRFRFGVSWIDVKLGCACW